MTTTLLKADHKNPKLNVTQPDLSQKGIEEMASNLRGLLADVFVLYVKIKNFHWHMSGPNFRDYHLMLDGHGDQVFAMTDVIAERIRKLGGEALHSISDITRHQRLHDDNRSQLSPATMLSELLADNRLLAQYLRQSHSLCELNGDVATTSLIENWVDETERRAWFLREIVGAAETYS